MFQFEDIHYMTYEKPSKMLILLDLLNLVF